MRNIIITLCLGMSLFLNLPKSAMALGLGPAELHSHWGEPLALSIPIYLGKRDSIDALRAQLAEPSVWQQLQIDYRFAYNSIRFELTDTAPYMLKVSSEKSFTEPFVELVVAVSSASQTVNRSLTVLLDPPEIQGTIAHK